MRAFSFLLTLLFLSAAMAGQEIDFASYYEQAIQARYAMDQQDSVEAIDLFQRAFDDVEIPKYYDLRDALSLAQDVGRTDLVERYLFRLVQLYGNRRAINLIQDSVQRNRLSEQVDSVYSFFLRGLDSFYIQKLDAMYGADQAIRKGGSVLYENNINSDSIRTMQLVQLIDERGFPSPKKVGLRGYNNAKLIFLHADFDLHNQLLGDLIRLHHRMGNLDPRDYASIIDRRCNFRHEPPYYYQVPMGYDSLTKDEKEVVKRRRKSIGLRDVEDCMVIEMLPNGDIRTHYRY